jgi:hypothetical protein
MRTKLKNKNKVLTLLLPIRGMGEFLLNSPCRNVSSSEEMWRGTRKIWSWFYERIFSLHRTLSEGSDPNRVLYIEYSTVGR